jgi:sulfotransferase family protein
MLEVIGAGFGRTGTHSLGLALEKLGFGPCYTLHEVAKNPNHREVWNNAMNKKPINWEDLFSSYKSAVEWPSVTFFEELVQQFPDAKIILTMKDPESWYESAENTIFDGLELSVHNPDPIKRKNSGMIRRLILEYTFEGRYRDKEYAIEVYRKHIQRVVGLVPKERLLQFDVKDGWGPLCIFLQKSIPNEPFPRLNERTDFMNSAPTWARNIKLARARKGS